MDLSCQWRISGKSLRYVTTYHFSAPIRLFRPMIPKLPITECLKKTYRVFLKTLEDAEFSGDILTSYSQRLIYATDNSIYQVLPQAVVCPKHAEDVQVLMRLANQTAFRTIQLAARGGGTGTNGQALSQGIIIDVSRYMTHILELNLEQGWVRTQPGVILDQLNTYLKPHGVFFAPELSPSDRATVGGMVNTDACGKGSRLYGRTSQHIVELSTVLNDGTLMQHQSLSAEQNQAIQQRQDRVGAIHRTLSQLCAENHELAQQTLPKLSRFLSGYNLLHTYDSDNGALNLNYLLAGSEGTLAIMTEMKLKLTPLPKATWLVAIQYDNFDSALRAAQDLLAMDPAAIETIDDKIVALARQDEIWLKVEKVLSHDRIDQTAAINLVEFIAEDSADIAKQKQQIEVLLKQQSSILHYTLVDHPNDIHFLWKFRKKGVGLLGNTKGNRKPIPFVEDTAVPPEHLADYILEFRRLLDDEGLQYGMFGHIDVGCLHVRPALDLKDLQDVKRLRVLSDAVCALVKKYGGVIWGEHGKGFRAEYMTDFFGEELHTVLRQIKTLFDPHNQLNPGKICAPFAHAMPSQQPKESTTAHNIPALDAPQKRDEFDRQIAPALQHSFEKTQACNGNGACYSWHADNVICPSWKGTHDRVHSPKGRAGMMREWLRQMSLQREDILATEQMAEQQGIWGKFRTWIPRLWATIQRRDDFSHEVLAAMEGCLGCKACVSQCPVHVNVPQFRARFLQLYYTRYLRSLKDVFIANIERLAWFLAWTPSLSNALTTNTFSQKVVEKGVGLTALPSLSTPSLRKRFKQHHIQVLTPKNLQKLAALPETERQNHVLLVQDAFTSFYDANVVMAFHQCLTQLGYHVWCLPFRPNGKPQHVRGLLAKFNRTAQRHAALLSHCASLDIPMIGIDPSMTLTFRDEYSPIKRTLKHTFEVQLLQEWLSEKRERLQRMQLHSEKHYILFLHCSEQSLSLKSAEQWQTVFQALGLQLTIQATGCCGMAGTYGHEVGHQKTSKAIFFNHWAPHLERHQLDKQVVLSTGYSCRSQVKRMINQRLAHPVEALAALMQA